MPGADEMYSSHYSVFHQMEGVKIFPKEELAGCDSDDDLIRLLEQDLKKGSKGLAKELFRDLVCSAVSIYMCIWFYVFVKLCFPYIVSCRLRKAKIF